MKPLFDRKCCLLFTGLMACSTALVAQSKPAGPPEAPLPKFLNAPVAMKETNTAEPLKIPSQGVPQEKPLNAAELKKKLKPLPPPKKS